MKVRKVLFATMVFSLLFSCGKDNDSSSSEDPKPSGDPTPTENSHRIKQIVYDDYEKTNFSYDGEKLDEVMMFEKDDSGNWTEDRKYEFTYSGNNVTKIGYYYETGIWEMSYKTEYVIQNGLMTEYTDYNFNNGIWTEDEKETYQYSGSDITAWQAFDFNNDSETLEPEYKGEFIYQDGKIGEHKGYEMNESGDWFQDDKYIFSYTGNDLTSLIGYELNDSDNFVQDFKDELTYSENKVSGIYYFYWDNESTEWEPEGSVSFAYDENEYLVEISYVEEGIAILEYEVGNGNAILFWYDPEDLVYGEPSLKNARLNRDKKYMPYMQRIMNR